MEDWISATMTDADKVDAYDELRIRVERMGYSTIGAALDELRRIEAIGGSDGDDDDYGYEFA